MMQHVCGNQGLKLTEIVHILPLQSHLQVMVLRDDGSKFLQQITTLLVVQFVNVLWKRAQGEDAFPASNRVGSYNRMNSFQFLSNVLRTASLFLVQFHPLWVCFSGADESVANESGSQSFKELLISLREAVVYLVTRSPEGVASSLRQLGQSQRCVVSGYRLKLDVGMPLRGVIATIAGLSGTLFVAEDLLSRKRAYGADLRIIDAELRCVV
jgi:hypothetical protein